MILRADARREKRQPKRKPVQKHPHCEVCEEPVNRPTDLGGCGRCGRLFGPCCNSEQDARCVECAV